MPEPTEDATAEPQNGSTREWRAVARRPLLKAAGVGAALPLGGGAIAAAQDDDDADGGAQSSAADDAGDQIDPVWGYPTTDAEDVPSALEPDHEVELLVAPPAGPGSPPFLYFEPVGLQLEAGDVVQFTAASPDHTVTAMHPDIGLDRRVPEAAEPFSSPVLGPGMAWLYRFEHEGVYDVYCAPHLLFGMVMRLVVGDLDEEDVPEYAETVEGLPNEEQFEAGLNAMSEQNEDCEWPPLLPAAVLGADALDVQNVQDSGEVSFAAVAEELGHEFDPEAELPHETDGNATDPEGAQNATADHDRSGG